MLGIPNTINNFCPVSSANLSVSSSSASVTFSTIPGRIIQSYQITNKGTHGAYIAYGNGSATAVASTSSPQAGCSYVGAGAILTSDFVLSSGAVVDTIAAIQDGGSTTLEISIGRGQ